MPAPILPVLPPGSPPASAEPKERLRQACQEFEAMFIYKLLERMRATVPQEGFLHNAQEDVYQAICDQQVAAALARGKGIGLADMLLRQLSRQELSGENQGETDGGRQGGGPQAR